MHEPAAVAALSALAHQHRLRIFRLLVRAGPSGVPAGEIAESVGISPTNTSFHLKELDHATAFPMGGIRQIRASSALSYVKSRS